MLTDQELDRIMDQEGPLAGEPVFDTVFRDEPELAHAFVDFCREHRPAAFIDWSARTSEHRRVHWFMATVVDLELATRDDGRTLDAFLEQLPSAEAERATRLIKEALGTTDLPIQRSASATSDPRALVLPSFCRWLANPNRTQRERCTLTATEWIPRLRRLPASDREAAAAALTRTIKSPKLKKDLKALLDDLGHG